MDKSKELFLGTKSSGIDPNLVVYGSLIGGLCRKINPSVVVYSSLIHGFRCLGDWDEAKDLFIYSDVKSSMQPGAVAYVVMIGELCG